MELKDKEVQFYRQGLTKVIHCVLSPVRAVSIDYSCTEVQRQDKTSQINLDITFTEQGLKLNIIYVRIYGFIPKHITALHTYFFYIVIKDI